MAGKSTRINKIIEMCKAGDGPSSFQNKNKANITNIAAKSSVLESSSMAVNKIVLDNSTNNLDIENLILDKLSIISSEQTVVTNVTAGILSASNSLPIISEKKSSISSACEVNFNHSSTSSLKLLSAEDDLMSSENRTYYSETSSVRPTSPENNTKIPHTPVPLDKYSMDDFSSGSSDLWEPTYKKRKGNSFNTDAVPIESESSDDNIPLSHFAVRKRKKGQGPMQRKLRRQRTESRKKGEAYVTAKGKSIPAKALLPIPENCRAKCYAKIATINLNEVFKDYRALPNRDIQKRYLTSLITIKPKERTRRSTCAKNREVTVLYTLDGINGNICKNCFLKVFAETRGFLDDIIKKKKLSLTSIVLESDLRTGHQPGNKRSEADITFAKDFINSIPAYESHYSRRHTVKRYLEPDMNLQLLYKLYKEKFVNARQNPSEKPLGLSVFRNVFKTLNLKFKKPSNDTCKTCDSLFLKIKTSLSEEKKREFEHEMTQHQNKASFHYETKKADKKISEESAGKITVAAFDLQKCLPTPNLSASVSFYKRKLWTFNLTVRNITTKRTACYVWHKTIAQRGADEIASCVFQFIKDSSDEVEKLILYSDTCPGQNRNNILPVMFMMALEEKPTLKEIHHKFLVPGHTHLECDTDHAAIERFVKKRNSTVSVPQDWVSLIKMTSTRYDVKLMKQADFFGFSKVLLTHFMKRNVAKDKTSFAWNNVFWLFYKKGSDVGFKYTLNSEEPFRFYSMQKRGKSVSIANIQLVPAYTEPVPLDELKYKDILDLLPYIDPIYHDFYIKLKKSPSKTTLYVSDSDEDFD
ncbi:unnamed protein product [Psylliodes chrysocephalus]|uniref:DUF7869 domain-containing protein n=1 Tax=Psylliodes chrysocephalus TaxID=3402493 RepID=A0A9P0CW37_9CUCU|nr:unnamed protein product [Psylliodes chrysocephala]